MCQDLSTPGVADALGLDSAVLEAYDSAWKATALDDRDGVHPIRYSSHCSHCPNPIRGQTRRVKSFISRLEQRLRDYTVLGFHKDPEDFLIYLMYLIRCTLGVLTYNEACFGKSDSPFLIGAR